MRVTQSVVRKKREVCMEWCNSHGKLRYKTRHDAQKSIAGSKSRTGFDKPLTTYRCSACGDYHLTKITHYKAGKKSRKKGSR